jgi:hypothetical protein
MLWENKADLLPEIVSFVPGTILSLMIFTTSWLIMKFKAPKELRQVES